MPLPVIAGVNRVTFNWNGPNGTNAANVMHFLDGGGSVDTFIGLLTGNFVANMFNCISNQAVIFSFDVIPLDGVSATSVVLAPATALFKGETVSDPVFPDSAILKLRTGERGRSKRGRAYLPYPAEGAITLGTIVTGSLNAMQTAWNTFKASCAGDGIDWVVASYKFASYLEVTTVEVEGALATQRRRQSRFRRQVGY